MTVSYTHLDVYKRQGFDSDNLLLHPALRQGAGRRVLIVKGTLGRDLLRERLVERGAEVVVAEVYARCLLYTSSPPLAWGFSIVR